MYFLVISQFITFKEYLFYFIFCYVKDITLQIQALIPFQREKKKKSTNSFHLFLQPNEIVTTETNSFQFKVMQQILSKNRLAHITFLQHCMISHGCHMNPFYHFQKASFQQQILIKYLDKRKTSTYQILFIVSYTSNIV